MVNAETGQWKAVDPDDIEELEYNGDLYNDETFAKATDHNRGNN